MDRFIESLLLGYPIPGIFLVRQSDKRYLVLDGQQRLRTLQAFMDGVHEDKVFALKNVAGEFKSLTYKTLPEDLRRTFDDTFIQATVVATDGSAESLEAVYRIFERLNSGGTQLTPHEIRVALYAGPFIDFIEQLNRNPAWRALYGPKSPRLRDQELVLRILALAAQPDEYKRPLKSFLNNFVAKYRYLSGSTGLVYDLNSDVLQASFETAASLLEKVGREYLRPRGSQLNAALTEALFVGLIQRIATTVPSPSVRKVRTALTSLLNNETLTASTTKATADEENVRLRVAAATSRLASV